MANSPERKYERFQKEFLIQQQLLAEKTRDVDNILSANSNQYWPLLERALNPENIFSQIYLRDSLVFWNSQYINNEILLRLDNKVDTVLKLSAGWFLVHSSESDGFDIYLLKQIKSEYEYDNSFLPDNINVDFGGAQKIKFTTDLKEAQFVAKDIDGQESLGLIIDGNIEYQTTTIVLLFFVYLLIYLAVIVIIEKLYNIVNGLSNRNINYIYFFIIDLILLRFLDYYFSFPAALKGSFLFTPHANEIAGLNTPGDMVINSMLLLVIAYKVFSVLTTDQYAEQKTHKTVIQILGSLFILFITFILFFAITVGINNLDYHSLIGDNLFNIAAVSTIISIVFLGFALYLFLSAYLTTLNKSTTYYYLPIVINALFGILFYFLFPSFGFLIIIATSFVILAILINNYRTRSQDILMIKFLLIAILFASAGAVVINQAINDNKNQHQQLMAGLLTESHDLNLESYFDEVTLKLENDSRLKSIIEINEEPEYELDRYISDTYFGDFINKYRIQITVCEEGEFLEVRDDGFIYDCNAYFEGLLKNQNTESIRTNLYLIESEPASVYYIGQIVIADSINPETHYNLFVEFYYSYVPQGLGYPELLIDNSSIDVDLSGYSFGFYQDDQLSLKFGEFPYQTTLSFIKKFSNDQFFKLSGFTHYKIELNDNQCLVISRPNVRLSEQLVTFSSVFLCFIFITFITLIVIFGRKTRSQLALSFRNRLQILFVSTISFVIALLALITLYYVEANNEHKLREQLNEKTVSVLIELEHKLSSDTSLYQKDESYMIDLLRKFSLVFFSDINLYNTSGQIVASSRPEIFQRGLISENINPLAYEELFVKNKLFYITQESIGKASYYSSYAPLILNTGQTVGIVNLPYFARQTEVRKAYYLMLFTFINLFVIFGILGALLGLLLSRIIAKPLFLLQESIGNIRIDKKNEKINWDRNDEIGQLIAEYNHMVDKLEQSAEMLKHSERENTWREVARQIAHEIKNPLTPMKLNVQYLEKAYNENDPDFDKKVKNISASLITQIDALDKVAEMFSDFAKSNAGKFEDVDLQKVIRSTVSLFRSHSNIDFHFEVENQDETYFVKAVEKDVLRVFNNLLKNAIQSLENKNDGKIEVFLGKENHHVIVQIVDNGKGIPVEARVKIFQPYFTTKSGGTGLGLAIVKNIMTEIGGEIKFEPSDKGGTVFILRFNQSF
jgi:signal transduction histidine kinase